jgi:hypothetical protein
MNNSLGSVNLFNAWNHVAIVCSGTTVKLYINGTAQATTVTSSYNFNDVNQLPTNRYRFHFEAQQTV